MIYIQVKIYLFFFNLGFYPMIIFQGQSSFIEAEEAISSRINLFTASRREEAVSEVMW